MIKKIYLDICTFCRPFDDQRQIRIRMETDAYFLIIRAIEQNLYRPVISPVHFAEIEAIKKLPEKLEMRGLLRRLKTKLSFNEEQVRDRTEELISLNFGIADAAHVAFAETASDGFITCDDTLLRKCIKHKIAVPVFNPVEFALREKLK